MKGLSARETSTSLYQANPVFLKEWHANKNRDITPKHVTIGSNSKIWWICPKKVMNGKTPYLTE